MCHPPSKYEPETGMLRPFTPWVALRICPGVFGEDSLTPTCLPSIGSYGNVVAARLCEEVFQYGQIALHNRPTEIHHRRCRNLEGVQPVAPGPCVGDTFGIWFEFFWSVHDALVTLGWAVTPLGWDPGEGITTLPQHESCKLVRKKAQMIRNTAFCLCTSAIQSSRVRALGNNSKEVKCAHCGNVDHWELGKVNCVRNSECARSSAGKDCRDPRDVLSKRFARAPFLDALLVKLL